MTLAESKNWLTQHALPLWLERGVDPSNGGFVECLMLGTTEAPPLPRRCTVETRQIYVCRMALERDLGARELASHALDSGLAFFLRHYSLPNGAFRHSVQANGAPHDDTPDLYAQAFALFGLANAFAVLGEARLRERAEACLAYLRRERAAPGGGFTELEKGAVVYRSNPHMHLFEAALAWMEVDASPAWHQLAAELLNLALARFIDPVSGALAENFTEGWQRELVAGRFIYEPGHQFEWSWLMGWYSRLTGRDLRAPREALFALAERHGLYPQTHYIYDQMWSDHTPKALTSRFWPHCERIKAAAALGRREEALDGLGVLFRYFDTNPRGLWHDVWDQGRFPPAPAKASSLYHILGGILEAQSLG